MRHVVVPPDGACTLTRSNVTGNVTVLKEASFNALGTEIRGDVEGHSALTIGTDAGTEVDGDVQTKRTHQVLLFRSKLGGVQVQGTDDRVDVCDNSVRDDVQVEQSGPAVSVTEGRLVTMVVLVGLGPEFAFCRGNTVGGDIQADQNDASLLFVINNSVQNMEVSENTGSDKAVQLNRGQELQCEGNSPLFVGGPNTFAQAEGQCF